jgi:hypothetical protein
VRDKGREIARGGREREKKGMNKIKKRRKKTLTSKRFTVTTPLSDGQVADPSFVVLDSNCQYSP